MSVAFFSHLSFALSVWPVTQPLGQLCVQSEGTPARLCTSLQRSLVGAVWARVQWAE